MSIEILKTDQLGDHKLLVALAGLPYSGKSTYAKTLDAPIVNPDSIRVALHGHKFIPEAEPFVWAIAKAMVKSLFLAGHPTVVLDATNTTEKRRDEWISMEWTTKFVCIDTPIDVCKERAMSAGDLKIIPIIDKMASELVYPDGQVVGWLRKA